MRLIIGITGPKGSGKDTAANALIRQGFQRYGFADPLKLWVATAMRLPTYMFTDNDKKDAELPSGHRKLDPFQLLSMFNQAREFYTIPDHLYDEAVKKIVGKRFKTPREVLQFVGTDVFRACVSEDFWVHVAEKHWRKMPGNIVVSDVRFLNEAFRVNSAGGHVIRIDRELPATDQHESELQFDSIKADLVIKNTGSIEELETKVLDALSQWQK